MTRKANAWTAAAPGRDHDVADAAELLEAAREALASELLPALPEAVRYSGLMIANALAIAAREVAEGPATIRREIALLRPLAAQAVPPSDAGSDDVHALRRIVAAAIRDGRFDDDVHARALVAALDDIAAGRVAISNPRALR